MTARLNSLCVSCLLVMLLTACSREKEPPRAQAPARTSRQAEKTEPQIKELQAEDEVAVITTDFGRIILRFYPEIATNHVNNFKSLARAKFYDGTTFHRVIPPGVGSLAVIQGGDPNSRDDNLGNDGRGDGPRSLRAEFSRERHRRGILSMARGQNPHSASCQFFICLADAFFLDGQYSVFGKVVKGIEVADNIAALPRNEKDNPGKAATIRSITIERAGDVLEFPLS